MDSNISLQIKRLIEVDRRAVDLENKRETELLQLKQAKEDMVEDLEAQLKAAKEEAKDIYQRLVSQAQEQVEADAAEVNQRLQKIDNLISQEVDSIAADWWNKILQDMK